MSMKNKGKAFLPIGFAARKIQGLVWRTDIFQRRNGFMRNFVMEYLVIPVITVFECIKGFFIGIKLCVLWGFG